MQIVDVPNSPVSRFAPSPTGRLHLGHVANAVWTWGLVRANGGRVLLRLEDHDRGRCRPEFERSILQDLEWLGLEPDEPPAASLTSSAPSAFRQSDCGPRYLGVMESFAKRGLVFGCTCSRRTVQRALGLASVPAGDEMRYPGTCRAAGLAASPGRSVRLRLPDRSVSFDDLQRGAQTQHPQQQCGDLLLRDNRGQWTYQFCVAVDDAQQGVDLVIRGDDLLPSTGRQLLVFDLLDRRPPAYLHHPLIYGPVPGVKLSKRDGAAGLDELRAAGWSAARVLGEAAYRTSLLTRPSEVPAGRLPDLFC